MSDSKSLKDVDVVRWMNGDLSTNGVKLSSHYSPVEY